MLKPTGWEAFTYQGKLAMRTVGTIARTALPAAFVCVDDVGRVLSRQPPGHGDGAMLVGPIQREPRPEFRVLELFAGLGVWSWTAEAIGMSVVGRVEFDPAICKTHASSCGEEVKPFDFVDIGRWGSSSRW